MQTKKFVRPLVAMSLILALFSCKKEYETVEQLDNKNIQAYKDAHPGTSFTDTAGYAYTIAQLGSGSYVKNTDSIYYSYKFSTLSGTVLNETKELTIPGTYLGYSDQFVIGSSKYTLKPIREVFAKLRRGGKATVLIPSRMAFGKNGLSSFGIGPNECIVVEIGLYTFSKKHEVDAYETAKFITDNNLTFNTDPNGIKYQVITAGTGTEPISEFSTLGVSYTGRYLDGTVFDSNSSASFRLDQLIKGWQLILPGRITAGGKIRVIIPSHLAYGTSPLDFDISISKVSNN